VLYRHPAVMEAAVVALPDEKWGETPCAFLELKSGREGQRSEEVIAFCKEHLAGFKVPRKVVFCELPKTSTGKIQKFALRDEGAGASSSAQNQTVKRPNSTVRVLIVLIFGGPGARRRHGASGRLRDQRSPGKAASTPDPPCRPSVVDLRCARTRLQRQQGRYGGLRNLGKLSKDAS
jgi:hypothetical protein